MIVIKNYTMDAESAKEGMMWLRKEFPKFAGGKAHDYHDEFVANLVVRGCTIEEAADILWDVLGSNVLGADSLSSEDYDDIVEAQNIKLREEHFRRLERAKPLHH